jgi:hypothetical protein
MSADETVPVEEAVEAYVSATGYTPSHVHQILAELREPGVVPLDLLGDSLPYFLKDGVPVVERARFDALMARVRERQAAHGDVEG